MLNLPNEVLNPIFYYCIHTGSEPALTYYNLSLTCNKFNSILKDAYFINSNISLVNREITLGENNNNNQWTINSRKKKSNLKGKKTLWQKTLLYLLIIANSKEKRSQLIDSNLYFIYSIKAYYLKAILDTKFDIYFKEGTLLKAVFATFMHFLEILELLKLGKPNLLTPSFHHHNILNVFANILEMVKYVKSHSDLKTLLLELFETLKINSASKNKINFTTNSLENINNFNKNEIITQLESILLKAENNNFNFNVILQILFGIKTIYDETKEGKKLCSLAFLIKLSQSFANAKFIGMFENVTIPNDLKMSPCPFLFLCYITANLEHSFTNSQLNHSFNNVYLSYPLSRLQKAVNFYPKLLKTTEELLQSLLSNALPSQRAMTHSERFLLELHLALLKEKNKETFLINKLEQFVQIKGSPNNTLKISYSLDILAEYKEESPNKQLICPLALFLEIGSYFLENVGINVRLLKAKDLARCMAGYVKCTDPNIKSQLLNRIHTSMHTYPFLKKQGNAFLDKHVFKRNL